MSTLDTLTVCFEADAAALFSSMDTLETRLAALRAGSVQTLPAMGDVLMQLTVAADDAISRALQNAGNTLSAAVLSHEAQFSSSLQSSQQAMASALRSAAQQLSPTIHVTVPVTISGQRVSSASEKFNTQRALQTGALKL